MWRLIAVLFFVSANAMAAWQLDSEASSLHFMSVKNDHIAEVHTFDSLSGLVEKGKAKIDVPLVSVNTLIPIRNERMQSMLFDVANFPAASFTADIDDALMQLTAGQSTQTTVSGTLSLHGKEVDAAFAVRVTRTSNHELVIATTKPYVLQVADFGLKGGIDALQKIAGLKVISYAVPVTFNVVFNQVGY